jgi:hypothetical protein
MAKDSEDNLSWGAGCGEEGLSHRQLNNWERNPSDAVVLVLASKPKDQMRLSLGGHN